MQYPGRVGALALSLVTAALPAQSQSRTPSVSCTVADHNIALELLLPLKPDLSRAPAPAGMQGNLEIHHQKLPRERRSWSLDDRQPTQMWLQGLDLKLRLLLDPETLVDLIIEAQRRALVDTSYAGHFRLETAEGVRVTGRIACEAG